MRLLLFWSVGGGVHSRKHKNQSLEALLTIEIIMLITFSFVGELWVIYNKFTFCVMESLPMVLVNARQFVNHVDYYIIAFLVVHFLETLYTTVVMLEA